MLFNRGTPCVTRLDPQQKVIVTRAGLRGSRNARLGQVLLGAFGTKRLFGVADAPAGCFKVQARAGGYSLAYRAASAVSQLGPICWAGGRRSSGPCLEPTGRCTAQIKALRSAALIGHLSFLPTGTVGGL